MVVKTSRRLTRRQVLAIRKHYSAGETITRLAEAFDRSPETISSLVHFRTYKRVRDVEGLPPLPNSQDAPDAPQPRVSVRSKPRV